MFVYACYEACFTLFCTVMYSPVMLCNNGQEFKTFIIKKKPKQNQHIQGSTNKHNFINIQ